MSDLLIQSQRLAELGYGVFQCSPKGKTPFAPTAPHGCNSATTDITAVDKRWTQYPECNIGIKCSNILVFDLDCKDGIDGANDLRNIIQSIGKLPDSPIARTARKHYSGGWHLFFAKPDIDIIGQKKIRWQGQKTGIDIQTGNQYIIAPPSIHPNGKPYQWIKPLCPASELPQLPEEWIEKVLPKREAGDRRREDSGKAAVYSPLAPNPSSQLIARCRAYIAAMPPAVQGQAGHSAVLKVANVIFHGFGLSEADGWQLMLEYNSRCCPPWDLSNPKDEREFRRKIRQAIEKPPDNQPFGYLREQSSCTVSSGSADISAICNTQPNNNASGTANAVHPDTLRDKERLPERLQHVPGFIDKLVDFCFAYSPYPNRILALCGAIALMSFLTVRKVKFKSGLRPNLYIIGVASSGTGKDYIRKVNKHILSMSGQIDNIGEAIASGEGMEDEILAYKKKLFQTDEIQTLIRGITAGKDNYHLDYAASFLMTAYSSADSEYIGRAKAGSRKKETRTVREPGLILFGTTTPTTFYDSLTPAFLEDGLGSRSMFVEGEIRCDFNPAALDHSEIPQELIDTAQWWTDFIPPDPKTGKVSNLYDEHPTPHTIPITSEAETIINRIGTQADSNYRQTQSGVEQTIWTRVRENAIKTAMIYACSENYENPVIGTDAASWATEFVYWIQDKMIYLVRNHVAKGGFEKDLLRTKDIIRKRGGIISRNELARTLHKRTKELDEIILALKTEEAIEEFTEQTNGRYRIMYRLL